MSLTEVYLNIIQKGKLIDFKTLKLYQLIKFVNSEAKYIYLYNERGGNCVVHTQYF